MGVMDLESILDDNIISYIWYEIRILEYDLIC